MKTKATLKLCPFNKTSPCIVVEGLLDSGATTSFIRKEIVDRAGFPRQKLKKPWKVELAEKEKYVYSNELSVLETEIEPCGKMPAADQFYIVDNLKAEVIIGADFMDKYNIVLSKADPHLKKCRPNASIG